MKKLKKLVARHGIQGIHAHLNYLCLSADDYVKEDSKRKWVQLLKRRLTLLFLPLLFLRGFHHQVQILFLHFFYIRRNTMWILPCNCSSSCWVTEFNGKGNQRNLDRKKERSKENNIGNRDGIFRLTGLCTSESSGASINVPQSENLLCIILRLLCDEHPQSGAH